MKWSLYSDACIDIDLASSHSNIFQGELHMCGIIGYNGKLQAPGLLIEGLERLEYRGYDLSLIHI